ncbi:PQQ-dependent sugar dehydrogenase [Thermophagus xiamenensis]|uniref:Glucose/arabinose dehydrogenase, beta-propeller fold n=1 Tax=Thermophagus xiamenensis TaxID=385682 RepID=A0A1I2A338_9BACT|nr:PQQ-dependent sugar dehydrogenase [Thermophagus xiamenensis]SFE37130.1 Glucose/arabinose dehydrogenase, beta-propeller fold [Thermophagus xiamenensis]
MFNKKHITITGLFSVLIILLWALLTSTSSIGCSGQTSGGDAQAPRSPGQLYTNYCASCHGPYMERFAGEDRNALFARSQSEMERIIRDGDYETGMPAFGNVFSQTEIEGVARYILTDIKKKAGSHDYRPGFPEVVKTEELSFRIDTIATGLGIPWAMAWLPNGDMLVTERSGELFRFRGKTFAARIEEVPQVYANGQGGLLDIELHPDYENNGWIYLAYSEPEGNGGNTAIMRARLKDDQLVDREKIFKATPNTRSGVHFGCRMAFDKDHYLYFSVGERGNPSNAQDLTNHSGKIHRIHDDGKIPEDNPFVDTPGAIPSIWSYGHRNPQGLAFHPVTGELWETEHGPKGGDELNIIKKGANYGWPEITYGINYDGTIITRDTAKAGMEQPIIHWTPSIAPCGMAFADSGVYPEWGNNIFSGSLSFRYLVRTVLKGNQVQKHEIMLREAGRVRSVETGPDGYLYIGVENPGVIFRLIPVDEGK